jgi:hypothetical protein
MPKPERTIRLGDLLGYFAIPHELLHLLGYRLVGRRCTYHWGQLYVTPLEAMPLRHRLVGLLLPAFVFGLIFLLCAVLSGLAYLQVQAEGGLAGFIFWLASGHIAALYLSTTVGDLRRAYLLIMGKPWQSWTPFDIFYWPFVDWAELRRQEPVSQIDD